MGYDIESLTLFLISILHQTATVPQLMLLLKCCSLSVFYIKPQRKQIADITSQSCSLSVFYIKPQRGRKPVATPSGCSLSVFYIKPQLRVWRAVCKTVVPYQYSTSNRNLRETETAKTKLFLISILHQTATYSPSFALRSGCSLSVFYIKPQLTPVSARAISVVPYQYSTSNRNCSHSKSFASYVVPYQYSTSNRNCR